jgi:hypothetical protein
MPDEKKESASEEKKNSKPARKRKETPAEAPLVEAPPAEAPPPEDQRWRLDEEFRYVVRGAVITLAAGSVVSESTHDVLSLVSDGANLTKL